MYNLESSEPNDRVELESLSKKLLGNVYIGTFMIQFMIYCFQICYSIKFFRHTKNVKEVGKLTKRMICLANISGASLIVATGLFYVRYLLNKNIFLNAAYGQLLLFGILPTGYTMAMWMRLLRVQV